MRISRVVMAVAAAAVLGGCAGAPADQSAGDGDTVYTVFTTILQAGEDQAPVLCLGGVMESYPPQCFGPELVGLDWDDVPDAQTVSGVTWGTGWAVGSYDREAETFTLTEPVRQDQPEGVAPLPDEIASDTTGGDNPVSDSDSVSTSP